MDVQKEIDRILNLVRAKMRDQNFTQLDVQAEMGWGKSYISQLMTHQKRLQVEQVLSILHVIGVEPSSFFAELYRFPEVAAGTYPTPSAAESAVAERTAVWDGPTSGTGAELRSLVRGLIRVLLDNGTVTLESLTAAVREESEALAEHLRTDLAERA